MNQLSLSIILLFLLFSCAHQNHQPTPNIEVKVPYIETFEKEVSPGHVLLFNKTLTNKVTQVKCQNEIIPFHFQDNKVSFFWAESYFSNAKNRTCHIFSGKQLLKKLHIKVVPYDYPSEQLTVNKRRVVVNQVDQQRAQKERAFLNRIYKNSSKTRYFSNGFVTPLESFITSHYGKRRIFNGVRKTQHLGVDLRAWTGVPIPSSQRGRVVFAGDLFYTGNTVILDHGIGVFTVYAHLSKIKVKMGQIVGQQQVVGLAGSTGRVTGPHLHWGTKIHGHWVDGMILVEQTKRI